MKQKGFMLLILFLLMLCSCIKNYALNEKEKIKIFYKYDQLFQDLLENEPVYNVEKGDGFEIFSIDKISKSYQNSAKEYLMFLEQMLKENILNFKEILTPKNGKLFPLVYLTKYSDEYKDVYEKYKKTMAKLRIAFDKYNNCVRIIHGYDVYIVNIEAREIEKGLYATQKYFLKNNMSQVQWSAHYFALKWGKEPKVKKEDGTIFDRTLRQDYWFYESNLKLCVVHKIKDDKGNYFGELELDFYKLDDFDKLFDEKGNPKN
jgi:hypothetical protein